MNEWLMAHSVACVATACGIMLVALAFLLLDEWTQKTDESGYFGYDGEKDEYDFFPVGWIPPPEEEVRMLRDIQFRRN